MRILWRNCRITTMANGQYNLIEDAALLNRRRQNCLGWGPYSQRPNLPYDEERDLRGKLVTPVLSTATPIACSAATAARNFEMRLNGATYADIAAAGGRDSQHGGRPRARRTKPTC
ncbi:Imidazolonepropionase [Cedecea neteri]|uniref:Imidazolonepropionase n=1 Tax=Cedecea neteri TaxID=158822 RepID=A0A2X3J1F3_9ENTR|nr:Imidazolonepropionase [Cedecea neteri]